MQRVEGPQTPYEVYCYHCRVTFPKETRQCLHCGGRLGETATVVFPGKTAPAASGEAEEVPPWVRRFGALGIWGLIAVSAVVSNLCGRTP
jgi:hypothetical protein